MGSNGPGNPIIFEVIGLVVLCLVLVVVGMLIRSRGGLASRGAALAWAILCILPLFGVAFVTLVTHTVEKAEGKLPSGVNQYPAKSAP